jgi:hypothetical protein
MVAERELKSLSVPLFQRGNFLRGLLTPLWRGRGDFLGGIEGNYVANFSYRTQAPVRFSVVVQFGRRSLTS